MKILVVNGPNLNMLGTREPEIYGSQTYFDLEKIVENTGKEFGIETKCCQSNIEGEIVNFIQSAFFEKFDGIVINPAAYTHTSVAILDALKATKLPAIEVHISNIDEREEFRKFSFIKEYCIKTIIGEGLNGYRHAIIDMKNYLEDKKHGNK